MFAVRGSISAVVVTLAVAALASPGVAQSTPGQKPPASVVPPAPSAAPEKDPREGDPGYEQAQRLMKAVDAVLQDTAKNRGEARKLPSEKDFLMKPLWTETKED